MLFHSSLLSFSLFYIVMFRVLFVLGCLIALYYPLLFILLSFVYSLFYVV